MKQLALLLLLCLTLLQQGISQNSFPPAFDIVTDTIGMITLPVTNWQYAEDREAIWTIDSVRQTAIADKFHSNTPENRGKNDPMFKYWVRFRLKNTMEREAHFALQFLAGLQSNIYLFEPNGKKHHFVNGYFIPWNKKDGYTSKSGVAYIPVSILAGDEWVVYMKSYSSYSASRLRAIPSRLLIQLFSMDKMTSDFNQAEDSTYIKSIKDSVFFGILFWVAIFNLFFFTIVKERVYLYFALYVFFLGFTRFNGPLFHLFFRETPSIYYPFINPFCLVFLPFFITYFFRNLLKTYLYYPIWDKFLLVFNSIWFFSFTTNTFQLVPAKWLSLFGYIPTLVLAPLLYISLLATLILFIRRPEKSNRNLLFTLLPPFGTWVILWSVQQISNLLYIRFDIPLPSFYGWLATNWPNIEIICLVWMVVYFSWVLLERFNELRKQVVQKELEKEIERSQLIEEQKDKLEIQVEERTHELKLSLDNLKSTQAQLIQSEKLASLGELTAGIAHEIQNPLNFVNNFSEVNTELIDEMQQEMDKGNLAEAKEISNDIKENEQKINHHGKRAGDIVKGMLQHSSSGSGKKELTNINKLADEFLRLAYHGLRAKDKGDSAHRFNATMTTDFDETIGNINIIPQDIGRVILNLITNAFYVVNEKSKQGIEGFEPTVSITTKHSPLPGRGAWGEVLISVKDNGNGIPEKILDKIFQPFFTTKPTGQGIGLGLSLSYDIVKAHGGELKVETKEGEGSTFIIQLPIA